MKAVRTFMILLIVVGCIGGALSFVIVNWSWVFAKRVRGRVVNVERVTDPNAIISSRVTEGQLHSYAILIQSFDGNLYTASSEDRQWQVVKKGYCVNALLYVYPPWELNKANTYYNARMDGVSMCPGDTQLPGTDAPPPVHPQDQAAPEHSRKPGETPTPPAPVLPPSPPSPPAAPSH